MGFLKKSSVDQLALIGVLGVIGLTAAWKDQWTTVGLVVAGVLGLLKSSHGGDAA